MPLTPLRRYLKPTRRQESPTPSDPTLSSLTHEVMRLRFQNKELWDQNCGLKVANQRLRNELKIMELREKDMLGRHQVSFAVHPTFQTVFEPPRPKERDILKTDGPARDRAATKTERWCMGEPPLRSIDVSGKSEFEESSQGQDRERKDGEAAAASENGFKWIPVL
jgi:hypothetical protein